MKIVTTYYIAAELRRIADEADEERLTIASEELSA